MKAIAICGQKGGAGRTTVALNLAYELSHQGLRVLLIDGDANGGISLSIAPAMTTCPGLVRFVR
ncbi:MAG TPA: ParA family protein, partial [Nannocystis exedens]|nr:ParA family protein [Nannocystis exedens]